MRYYSDDQIEVQKYLDKNKKLLNLSGFAKQLNISTSYMHRIIDGRRISPKYLNKIKLIIRELYENTKSES